MFPVEHSARLMFHVEHSTSGNATTMGGGCRLAEHQTFSMFHVEHRGERERGVGDSNVQFHC